MTTTLSQRLAEIVDALPLYEGIRVLEIGCGTGAAAREIAKRIGSGGYVLGIDRSANAIQQATAKTEQEMRAGTIGFRQTAAENFELQETEKPFDVAIAIRVGALDGRHPELEKQALKAIAKALTKKGQLFIDGGNPLKEISLEQYR